MVVSGERLKKYILHKFQNELSEGPFCVVYFHTTAQKDDNCPGLTILRWIYEELPSDYKDRLQTLYFVHPGLRSRLVLATLGRFFLSGRWVRSPYVEFVEIWSIFLIKLRFNICNYCCCFFMDRIQLLLISASIGNCLSSFWFHKLWEFYHCSCNIIIIYFCSWNFHSFQLTLLQSRLFFHHTVYICMYVYVYEHESSYILIPGLVSLVIIYIYIYMYLCICI